MNPRMCAVIGRTGHGKTTKVRDLILACDRVMILEQSNEKTEYPGVVRFGTWDALYGAMRHVNPRRFRVSFAPGTSRFVDCLRLAWVLAPVTVVIEEAGKYFPQHKKTSRHHMEAVNGVPGEFLEICERGRHAGRGAVNAVSLIAVSQRPMRLPLCLRAELDRVYAFRLNSKRDRDWLAECPGSDQEIAEASKDLQAFHYLNVDANGGCLAETTTP